MGEYREVGQESLEEVVTHWSQGFAASAVRPDRPEQAPTGG